MFAHQLVLINKTWIYKVSAAATDRSYSCLMAPVRFHIVPNARANKVVGGHGDAIKIKVRAPAVEGKANAALRGFLAEELRIPERNIVLERGQKSRDKLISIEELSEEEVRRRLLPTANQK